MELGADYLTHLNYAITLQRNDEIERARQQFEIFEGLFEAVLAESGEIDPDIVTQSELMKRALN